MQQRDNTIPQQPTPDVFDITTTTAAQNVGGVVDQIGQIEEEREREYHLQAIEGLDEDEVQEYLFANRTEDPRE